MPEEVNHNAENAQFPQEFRDSLALLTLHANMKNDPDLLEAYIETLQQITGTAHTASLLHSMTSLARECLALASEANGISEDYILQSIGHMLATESPHS